MEYEIFEHVSFFSHVFIFSVWSSVNVEGNEIKIFVLLLNKRNFEKRQDMRRTIARGELVIKKNCSFSTVLYEEEREYKQISFEKRIQHPAYFSIKPEAVPK